MARAMSFADDGAHAAADEGVFHGAEDDFVGAEVAERVEEGVVEAGLSWALRGAACRA